MRVLDFFATGWRENLGRLSDVEIVEGDMQSFEPDRPGEVRHSQADIERACTTFGYSASSDFAEGLRRTLEHAVEARRTAAVPAR